MLAAGAVDFAKSWNFPLNSLDCRALPYTSEVASMQFFSENHVLDVVRRELKRGIKPIAVGPQVFDLLVYLVQNRDRVVSKNDLIAMSGADALSLTRTSTAGSPLLARP